MNNAKVIAALNKVATERSDEDVHTIFLYLRQLDVFRIVADGPLKSIAATTRLERHPKDHILFRKGQSATCWYILISGSVLMNNQVYLPSGCFGKRSGMNLRRSSDCVVIQPSDMIAIDYPDVQRIPVHYPHSATGTLTRPPKPGPAAHAPPRPAHFHYRSSTVGHHQQHPQLQPQQQTAYPSSLSAYQPPTTFAAYQPRPPAYNKPAAGSRGAGYSIQHHGDLAYEFHQQFAAVAGRDDARYRAEPAARNLYHTSIPAQPPPQQQEQQHQQLLLQLQQHQQQQHRPFSAYVGVLPEPQRTADSGRAPAAHALTAPIYSSATIKRVPSPAPRTAAPPKESAYGYKESQARARQEADMWQTALPSTSTFQPTRAANGLLANASLIATDHADATPSTFHNSGPDPALIHLADSFDSGVQMKSSSTNSSNSSQPTTVPPPAPQPEVSDAAEKERFLAPSAQRINKMRVALNRKNSDDSAASIRMRSSIPGSLNPNLRRFRGRSTASSSTTDGDEFAGLPETAVDSDDDEDEEESIPSHDYSYTELKDNVRECLEKEPSERTSDDIHVLMEFMQQMPALASLPLSIKRQLCLKMGFAVVPDAGTVILQDGEKIDSWSVVVNGAVEQVRRNGERVEYRLGDGFGVQPHHRDQFNDGETRTLCDDCEFVLVEHQDYCSIMSTLDQHIEQENDQVTGEVVTEAERRVIGNQVALLIIKAKPDRLIQHLIEDTDSHMDDNYAHDFFLMYRVFIADPTIIMHRMLDWFQDRKHRDRVTCVLLNWVNNHFNDFECSQEMLRLLDTFEQSLEKAELFHQQSLLNITCSVKSHPRQATLTRSNRDQELHFSIIGGNANNQSLPATEGIYINHVEKASPAEKNGLKKGDEIVEANGQNFRSIPLAKALEILRESTHLSLTIKSNVMNYKEMLLRQETDVVDMPRSTGTMGRFQKKGGAEAAAGHRRSAADLGSQTELAASAPAASQTAGAPRNGADSASSGYSSSTATPALKASVFGKLRTMLRGQSQAGAVHEVDLATDTEGARGGGFGTLRASRSNPDISATLALNGADPARHHDPPLLARLPNQFPEHAVKVYRSDQSFRFLTVFPDTTARQIVQMALQEFGMQADAASDWSLCECVCSVAEKRVFIKQRRLPDDLQNLAERVGLASRLYLKNNSRSETLLPDELAPEVMKEAKINLYNLNAQFVAINLTLQDFDIFSSIEPTEYVDNLFNLESQYGWPQLKLFEDQFNREMWWVATEVCLERSAAKRAKTIKKFIKVARHCRDLRNFNSMFAIVSGLEKPAVRRLQHAWERVPAKYLKMLQELHTLMDPSRNMSKYRQHLAQVSASPPVIPIYPVTRKDLTFSHEAKPTCSGSLINFDKLRMIARIVRSVTALCSVKYDLEFMSTQAAFSEMTGTVRKSGTFSQNGTVKSLGNLSRKKLYEQTLMRRKVRTYLADLAVVDNEAELDQLSLACEPAPSAAPAHGSAPLQRRRPPSPTPSSLSSQSNQSNEQNRRVLAAQPKFGVESPQAIQKMLSLVQNSKVKPNSQSPLVPAKKPLQTQTLKRIPSFGTNGKGAEY